MIVATPSTEKTKRCPVCCQTQPLSEFRRRRRGREDRHPECRECRNRRMREEHARKKAKKEGDLLAKGHRELRDAANLQQVKFVLGEMISFFGGPQQFLDAWANQTEAEMARNLGGRRSSDVFLAVARVYEFTRPSGIDVSGLSVEEVSNLLGTILLKLHDRQPVDVAAGLRRAGWPEAE